jgi:hypothetical protein
VTANQQHIVHVPIPTWNRTTPWMRADRACSG